MVRGATKEQRDKARAKVRADRRGTTYQAAIKAAKTAKAELAEVCRFLRAVADDLPDERVKAMSREVLKVANEGNRS